MAARGVIRRLWAVERAKVRDHLLRLEREDRQRRFGGSVTDAHIETYCAGLDWGRGVVLGYVEGGEVRAVGELMPLGAAPPAPPRPRSRSSSRSRTAASAPSCCGG